MKDDIEEEEVESGAEDDSDLGERFDDDPDDDGEKMQGGHSIIDTGENRWSEWLRGYSPCYEGNMFSEATLADIRDRLKKERLLIISCFDKGIAVSAISAIMQKWTITYQSFHLPKQMEFDADLDVATLDATTKMVAFLPDQSETTRDLFSRYLLDIGLFNGLKDGLERQGGFMFLAIRPDHLPGSLIDRKRLQAIIWEIDYLDHLGLDAKSTASLRAQIKGGHWGETERGQYDKISNEKNLPEAMALIPKGVFVPGLNPEQKLELDKLYDSGELEKYVLFALTWFPNSTYHELNQVIFALLEQVDTIDLYSQKGILISRWEEDQDDIRERLDIRFILRNDQRRVLVFATHGRDDHFKYYFTHHRYSFLVKCLCLIRTSSILFQSADSIADNALKLITEIALGDPENAGEAWLKELVPAMAQLQIKATNETTPYAQLLKPLKPHERRHRISRILSAFCMAGMENVVSHVFEDLLYQTHYLEIFELARCMRTAPGFDEIHWLRQVVERDKSPEKHENTRDKVWSYLYRRGSQGVGLYPTLKALEKWRPAKHTRPSNNGNSSTMFIDLAYQLILESVVDYGEYQAGLWQDVPRLEWPYSHKIFGKIEKESLPYLVDLLHHPWVDGKLKQQWSKKQDKPGELHQHLAELAFHIPWPLKPGGSNELDWWEAVLKGFENRNPATAAKYNYTGPGFFFAGLVLWRWVSALVGYDLERIQQEAITLSRQLLACAVKNHNNFQREGLLRFWQGIQKQLEKANEQIPGKKATLLACYLERKAASLAIVQHLFLEQCEQSEFDQV